MSFDTPDALERLLDGQFKRAIQDRYPLELAAHFRRKQSPPEGILWSYLRIRQLANLKFRRQHPLEPYFADFYCAEARLVVEIDGAIHASRRVHDAVRDRWMREQGLAVLRFHAGLIPDSLRGILETIVRAAQSRIEALEKE